MTDDLDPIAADPSTAAALWKQRSRKHENRWKSTIGQTRAIADDLDDAFELLDQAFTSLERIRDRMIQLDPNTPAPSSTRSNPRSPE
jgi:hypothetical protein